MGFRDTMAGDKFCPKNQLVPFLETQFAPMSETARAYEANDQLQLAFICFKQYVHEVRLRKLVTFHLSEKLAVPATL